MNDFSNQIHAFYSELSASVSSKPGGASRLEIEQKLAEAGDADLEAMRNSLIDSSIAYHDFRNFIILGDPAVRIPPEGFEPSSGTKSFGGLAPAPTNAGDEPEPRAAPALPEIVAKAEAEKRLVLAESQELFSDQGVKLVSEGETVILLVAGTCHDVRELPSEEEGASADGKKVTFYEAAEHQDCDLLAEIRISATEARPARQVPLPCANGVYLRYGEALSMFGDFYSIPGVRLGDGEAAFRKVFETFDHGDAKEMARIGAAMATERKAVDASLQKTGSATSGYEKVSNDMDKMYNRATGGGQLHGLFPKGRFLQLAEVNYDHFCFDAVAAYRSGHAAACAEARKAARGQSVPERRKRLLVAYLMNACADHYLTDLFASGHLRVPRRELSEQFTPSLTGNLLARRMHNEDNACGLEVRNARGDVWMAFGDKYFHSPQHAKGRQIAREAVAVSAREVWLAFDGQANPDFRALKLVPDVADALANKANHAAMFIVVKGVLQVRKRRFDLDCYEWTSDMSGVSDLVWATIKESV